VRPMKTERLAALLLGLCLAAPALGMGGHAKLLAGSLSGDGEARRLAGWDLRLFQEGRRGPWRGRLALQSLGVRLADAAPLPLPDDRRRFLDLTRAHQGGAWRRVLRVDRLWLERRGPRWRWRLGRQAISWGQGLAYNPLDVFAPFPPVAIDTEYKPGEDALHGQRRLSGGADLQLLAVARREAGGQVVAPCDETLPAQQALRQGGLGQARHRAGVDLELDLLLARHRGDGLAAAGLARPLGGAMLRADLLYWSLAGARGAWEGVVNLDGAPGWSERPLYLFAEYYYQGLPEAALAERLLRGERFVTGRHHLAAGLQWQIHPLLGLRASLLADLDGRGGLLPAVLTWDPAEDWQAEGGAILPLGRGPLGAQPRWLYARLKRYF